jgi:type IV pilus assembly protein PilQ
MKRAIQWIWLVFLAAIMTAALPPVWGAPPAAPDASVQTAGAGYLENITFEKLPGKERVTLTVSKQSGVTVENPPGSAVLVRLENLFVPEGLRRPLSDAALPNVVRVTPVQKTADGRSWVIATIDLKQKVPYSVRQEGMNILIDFNVTSVAAAEPVQVKPLPVAPDFGALQTPSSAETPAKAAAAEKVYGGPRIFLDVQDADIKSVLRLLAEQGNVSIVSGDDVKGTLTLHIKDVPWEQALETILDLKGLTQKREGNVITTMTLEKMKKDEADRQAAMEAKRKSELERAQPAPEPLITRVVSIDYNDAKKLTENIRDFLTKDKDGKALGSVKVDEHSNSLIIQATRQEMTRLFPLIERIDKPTSQILIKANIVETTKDTARNLGIQWGGVFGQRAGNQSLYITPGGIGGSTVPPGSALSGGYTPTSGLTGIGGQGFGVNFPAAMTGTASASLGLLLGTIGGNILDVQLSALQKDGKLNILSSPSITTLDNQMAFTENGDIVPYATTETSGGTLTRSIKKEEATLRLEITPHVIDGEKLKMKIVVKKNEVDPSRNVDGNPYIIKKQTETNLIAQDGETIVISGLTKQKRLDGTSGVPWLKDIPVLGWLFKGEGKSELMEEVLIFITPTIIKPQEMAGIQTGP